MALKNALEISKESIRAISQLIDISKPSLPLGGPQHSFIGGQNHRFNSLKNCVCGSLKPGFTIPGYMSHLLWLVSPGTMSTLSRRRGS